MTVDGTALVTGASAGIGRALSVEFAANGHDVALVARREDELRALADRLEDDHDVSAHVLVKDLATQAAPGELYEETEARDIEVDVLVNNVGIGTQGAFVDNDPGRELDQLRPNVVTPTQLTHRFGGDMADRGRGGILNVASTAAWFPGPFMAIYYASKAYMKTFSEGIAEELRPEGVDVTVLCRGRWTRSSRRGPTTRRPRSGAGRCRTSRWSPARATRGYRTARPSSSPAGSTSLLTKLSGVLPSRLKRNSAKNLNTSE
jgi:short-subunit dehydrogenase